MSKLTANQAGNPMLLPVLRSLPLTLAVRSKDGTFLFQQTVADDSQGAAPREVITRDGEDERFCLQWGREIDAAGTPLSVFATLDITARKRRERELERRALINLETGLPRLALLKDWIGRLPADLTVALALIEIANFDQIRQTIGRKATIELVVKIIRRLTAALRGDDILAEAGESVFALALDPAAGGEDACQRLTTVLSRLKAPFRIGDHELFVEMAAGICLHPDHGCSAEELLDKADIALRHCRTTAQQQVTMFDPEFERALSRRSVRARDVRLATLEHRFCCAYQPQVDIRTRAIHGVEVLARVRDDAGEIEGPNTFVELAGQLGLLDELMTELVGQVVSSLGAIDQQFGPDCHISFNLAAAQAGDAGFVASLIEILKHGGCPERFVFEVTEDAFVQRASFQRDVVPLLRRHGIRISIDDFGTGFSSLSALADLAADELKIDRSFIAGIHDRPRTQMVLGAIEKLGSALGMSIVAEGIETTDERDYLQSSTGIRVGQGYLFSRPVLLDEVGGNAARRFRSLAAGRTRQPARVPLRQRGADDSFHLR